MIFATIPYFAVVVSAAAAALLSVPTELLTKRILAARGLVTRIKPWLNYLMCALMAVCGGLIGWQTGLTMRLAYMLMMLAACRMIAVIDAEHRIIPNELILSIMALTGIAGLSGIIAIDLKSSFAGFICCFVIFMLPSVMSKKVGAGDVKMAAAMGFCAGLMPSMYAIAMMGGLVLIYLAVVSAAPHLAATRTVKAFKSMIPMGPFLAVSLIAVLTVFPVTA